MSDFGISTQGRAGPATQSWLVWRYSSVIGVLFVIYLVGAHLKLSLYSGGSLLVPMYPMLLSAAVLALMFASELLRRAGAAFFALALLVAVYPLLTVAPGSGYGGTLLGSLQFLVAIISALAMIVALQRLSQHKLRGIVLWFVGVILVLATLETFGLKPVFDPIREALYANSGRGIYDAVTRDLAIYGRNRATVFASEPSFLADTLFSLIVVSFFLDPKRGTTGSFLRAGALFVIAFYFIPSFKMAFYLIAAMIWQFWPNSQRRLVFLLIATGSLLTLTVVFSSTLFSLFAQFAGGHSESASFYGRIGVAHTFGLEALSRYPIFGFGFSNQEGTYPIISGIWQNSGAYAIFPWYQNAPAELLMSNGFWWQWIFLGLVGGIAVNLLVLALLRNVGVDKPMRTLVCTWIIWYAGSAYVDPHSWYMIVVFSLGALQYRTASTMRPGAQVVSR